MSNPVLATVFPMLQMRNPQDSPGVPAVYCAASNYVRVSQYAGGESARGYSLERGAGVIESKKRNKRLDTTVCGDPITITTG